MSSLPRPGSRAQTPGAWLGLVLFARDGALIMLQLIHDFLEHCELERNLSANTLRAYRSDLERFVTFLSAIT